MSLKERMSIDVQQKQRQLGVHTFGVLHGHVIYGGMALTREKIVLNEQPKFRVTHLYIYIYKTRKKTYKDIVRYTRAQYMTCVQFVFTHFSNLILFHYFYMFVFWYFLNFCDFAMAVAVFRWILSNFRCIKTKFLLYPRTIFAIYNGTWIAIGSTCTIWRCEYV